MKGQKFATIEGSKTASLEELKTVPKVLQCIISEGNYFEGNNKDIKNCIARRVEDCTKSASRTGKRAGTSVLYLRENTLRGQ